MLTELSRQQILAKRAEANKPAPAIPEKKPEEKVVPKKKSIFAPEKPEETEVATDDEHS